MFNQFDSLPIKIDASMSETMNGVYEASGILKYMKQTVILQVRTLQVDMTESPIKEYLLKLDKISGVEFKKPLLARPRLTFFLNDLHAVSGMIGVNGNKFTVTTDRKNGGTLMDLYTAMNLAISERRLSDLD